MPYCRCPSCGAQFHLRAATEDAEAWYRKHAPKQKVGELVESLPCLACWKKAGGEEPPQGSPS
jgi:hypothetical protein